TFFCADAGNEPANAKSKHIHKMRRVLVLVQKEQNNSIGGAKVITFLAILSTKNMLNRAQTE
ncbi:MAG: hypothetical protein ACTHNW_14325, partial [Mucilaginibacter sp.]